MGRRDPALGVALDWVEAHCVVPDGFRRGEPFQLYDYQLRFLADFYRVRSDLEGQDLRNPILGPAFVYAGGGLLIGPQKLGKGPFTAAHICLEAVGPALFAGWAGDDDGWACADWGCGCGWERPYQRGEPMGMPWPTPEIQVTAFSQEQPLALDTPVPTPAGWSTIGDLVVGDEVLDENGRPVPVVRATDVFLGERCYEVAFSDGERITASAGHGWVLEELNGHRDGFDEVEVTTEEIAARLRTPQGRRRFRAPRPMWELPERELPVDPYLLGLWLGDGRTADATIALDEAVAAELEELVRPLLEPHEEIVWDVNGVGRAATMRLRRRAGLCKWGHDFTGDLVHRSCGPCRRGAPRLAVPLLSMRERLRSIGVLGEKHIPVEYLRASAPQRRALLQGLIDSDGHIEATGAAGFTNVNGRLVDGVEELLVSLGMSPRRRWDSSVSAWRVGFAPVGGPVARLRHKAGRQRLGAARYPGRFVDSVRPVPSVPVRCIGTDTAMHLFLVGRRGVPTHNSDNVYKALRPMVEYGPLVSMIPKTGVEETKLPNGGEISTVTSSEQSRLGQRVTFCPQDEVGLWTKTNRMVSVGDTQHRGLAGMGGRPVMTTNAYDPLDQSFAQQILEAAEPDVLVYYRRPPKRLSTREAFQDPAKRRELLELVYEADVRRENGGHLDLDSVDASARKLAKRDLPQGMRFYGNIIVPSARTVIEPDAWAALARPDFVVPDGARVGAGWDGAISDDACALVLCTPERFLFVPIVDLGEGPRPTIWTRPPDADDDWLMPRLEIKLAWRQVFERYNVGRWFGDPPRWQSEQEELALEQGRYEDHEGHEQPRVLFFDTNSPKRMSGACDRFEQALGDDAEPRLTHDGNELLAAHVTNMAKRKAYLRHDEDPSDQRIRYVFVKPDDKSRKIDAGLAATLALEAAETMPLEPDVRPNIRWIS